MSRLLHIIPDTDMRARHEGLADWAKKNGVRWKNLKPGDIVAFLNTKRDRIMVLGVLDEEDSYGLLGYYRAPHGRVMPEAIQYIPKVFGGGRFNMNEATREALTEILERKARKRKKATSIAKKRRELPLEVTLMHERINRARIKRAWLAASMGVHLVTLKRWLNGSIGKPNDATWAKLEALVAAEENQLGLDKAGALIPEGSAFTQ